MSKCMKRRALVHRFRCIQAAKASRPARPDHAPRCANTCLKFCACTDQVCVLFRINVMVHDHEDDTSIVQ